MYVVACLLAHGFHWILHDLGTLGYTTTVCASARVFRCCGNAMLPNTNLHCAGFVGLKVSTHLGPFTVGFVGPHVCNVFRGAASEKDPQGRS